MLYAFLSSVDFFLIDFFKKKKKKKKKNSFWNTIRVSNSLDPDGSKVFAKVISRRQKLPLAGKELMVQPIFCQESSLERMNLLVS